MTWFLLGLMIGIALTLYFDNQKVRKSVNTNVKAMGRALFTKKKKVQEGRPDGRTETAQDTQVDSHPQ